ncbi:MULTISPECIES: restriction endonuclease [Rheinheimera]|jgi:hypothetical protein|uniref:Restriction endonuclease type IV Mrr domain-containing protein n=1 Tax=Rheinheimera tangshanensis TaxID=400153 RepID=A0A5C8M5M9_9GAMM|nr:MULTISPECIES: restriction endonuclease [Rheinheimera]KOO57111.1 hypothetical protein WH43_15835 [Rheinheimera sp. KL1]TXK83052.1 hypothetical protein FU839_01885 [Rheinheimera tangshanensis]GGM46691.1 hypothetical protein GCM10010920_03870 [Rheinheimera tangshanensis]
MNNKWLISSCIATAAGIVAGATYLLFSEYSVLSGGQSWVLSATWSSVMLWLFVSMFLLALLFNILAFLELERQEEVLNPMWWPQGTKLGRQQQQFKENTQHLLQFFGREMESVEDCDSHFLVRRQQQALLLYIQPELDQALTVAQVRSVFQQMLSLNCQRGLIVCYQKINSQVRLFAAEAGIELFDQQRLKKYINAENFSQLALI